MRAEPTQAATTLPPGSAGASLALPLDADFGTVSKPVVAGYEIVRLLGQGGMGVVWEAIELRLERRVALKVAHGARSDEARAQVATEAKLAARIAHPGIVPIHDFGLTLADEPYFTMDLVEGLDLSEVLARGRLELRRALRIGTAVALAVAAAHERGIAHCDLKPSNVVLGPDDSPRVLDFGLAGMIDRGGGDDAPLELVRGTVRYMPLEQLAGGPPSAEIDVYAIGVMLYEMLTGVPPIEETSPERKVHALLGTTPKLPSSHDAQITADLDRVCMRCLARDPENRYASAAPLARVLAQLLAGEPLDEREATSPAYEPRREIAAASPERDLQLEGAKYHRWSWTMASSPKQLWPLVANTDRLNGALGLPEVTFSAPPSPEEEGRFVRAGRATIFGLELAWDERPFEWIRDREHSVLRRYSAGPIEILLNRVRLTPLAGGGAELVHEIWARPRGAVGTMAALVEIDWKTRRNLDRLYRRLDATAAGGCATRARRDDPFEPPHAPSTAARARADLAVESLRKSHPFDPALVARLRDHVLYLPDKALEKLRPYALADQWGVERGEMLDLCLHAVDAGLLSLAWDLVCPKCRTAHETSAALAGVGRKGACDACKAMYDRDLADSVELVFLPHPSVRDAKPRLYCVAPPALRPHVVVQQLLRPRERRRIGVTLGPGDYRVVSQGAAPAAPIGLHASGAGCSRAASVRIGAAGLDVTPGAVAPGEVRLDLENETDAEALVRIEQRLDQTDRVPAVVAITHPAFRTLLSPQLLAYGEHFSASNMAFVFVELAERARLVEVYGEAFALASLRTIEESFSAVVARASGAIFEASFGRWIAAFATAGQALDAALAWERERARGPADGGLRTRVAVSVGRCLALTHGDRITYFGETIERGLGYLAASDTAVVVSSAVAERRECAKTIHDGHWSIRVTTLAGDARRERLHLLTPRG